MTVIDRDSIVLQTVAESVIGFAMSMFDRGMHVFAPVLATTSAIYASPILDQPWRHGQLDRI